jgi:hypothetical protein
MQLVDEGSLALTLDAVNENLFLGRRISRSARVRAATWIAKRQGLPGSYADMFAPTQQDFAHARLFTGEVIPSRVSTRHILGEEGIRALELLDVRTPEVRVALARAKAGMEACVTDTVSRPWGMYCCGTCSCAYWRNLAAGGLSHAEARLARGVKDMKARRLGTGRWRNIPFYYAVLALTEIDLPGARAELRYAAPALERYLRRAATSSTTAQRRRAVAERALACC